MTCTRIASAMPTPKPGANPRNVHAMSVPKMTVHSHHVMISMDSQSALAISSSPKKITSADAKIVGTYGNSRDETKKRPMVNTITMEASKRPPPASVKNRVDEKTCHHEIVFADQSKMKRLTTRFGTVPTAPLRILEIPCPRSSWSMLYTGMSRLSAIAGT